MKISKNTYRLLSIILCSTAISCLFSYGQHDPSSRDSLVHTIYGKKYDGIQNNSVGYYTVSKNDFVGLIDSLGNEVLPPIYLYIGIVGDGMVSVQTEEFGGYLNLSNGKIIGKSLLNKTPFRDGYAVVQKLEKDGRNYWGIINKKGKTIVPFKYESINGFYEGKACACAYNDAWQIKCGFVDKKGKVVIPLIYDNYNSKFVDGIAFVKDDNVFGGINEKGDTIIPFKYRGVKEIKNGFITVCFTTTDKHSGCWGIIDTSGNQIIPFMYSEIGYFNENIAVVKKGGYWGLINMQNQPLTEFKYTWELKFENGRAYLTKDKKKYLLENGKEINE